MYIYILYITITIPSPPTYLDNHQSPKWRWQSMYLDNWWAGATNPLLLSVFLHPPGQIRLILTASRGFPWGWSRSPAACPAPPPVPSPRGLARSPRTTGLDLETQGTRITVTNIIPVVHTLGAQFQTKSINLGMVSEMWVWTTSKCFRPGEPAVQKFESQISYQVKMQCQVYQFYSILTYQWYPMILWLSIHCYDLLGPFISSRLSYVFFFPTRFQLQSYNFDG